MKKVTINEVAEMAGVSIKSVSRVINQEPNVRPAMRAKVEAAIEALGYRPNLAARSLAAGRSFIIGVLFDNPSPHYTIKVQEGAYAACRKAGYQLVIEHIDTTEPDIIQTLETMLDHRRLDGMIVTPPATDRAEVLDALEKFKVPYIRIAPDSFPARSKSVNTDDAGSVQEAIRHLWDMGHRRFGFVAGPPSHGASRWRREGFYAALQALGLKPEDAIESEGNFTFSSGIGAGLHLLRCDPKPTAIFAANDDMAAGVLAAAARLGIRVPETLSVVGFDDSWIAQNVWPELTTLHQPIAEMAQTAVETLIEMKRTQKVVMPPHECHLVVRGSTGPAAA